MGQLQRAMFLYYIDCRVPFNEGIISEESQCAICKQLMIDPADIGHPDCKHIFCQLCIRQWKGMSDQSSDLNMYGNNNNYGYMGNMGGHDAHANRSNCPICRREIRNISVQPQVI